jgi:hypothetical protein
MDAEATISNVIANTETTAFDPFPLSVDSGFFLSSAIWSHIPQMNIGTESDAASSVDIVMIFDIYL